MAYFCGASASGLERAPGRLALPGPGRSDQDLPSVRLTSQKYYVFLHWHSHHPRLAGNPGLAILGSRYLFDTDI